MHGDYWTYAQWEAATIEKIVTCGLALDETDRADWLRLQIGLALGKALRHGRSGAADDDPVAP